MKNTKKALLMTLCAVMLVAASVMGTMAYLTDTSDTAVNTFTVGNVQIKLDEAKVDADGKEITGDGADRVLENSYKLLPGMTYDKDPMVTVLANSEDAYVRMFVTVEYDNTADAEGNTADAVLAKYKYQTWFDFNKQWVAQTNVETTKDGNKITRTYEFRYDTKVENATTDTALPALFTEIEMPGNMTNAELATLSGLKINVVGEAIQADGFATPDAAFEALNEAK